MRILILSKYYTNYLEYFFSSQNKGIHTSYDSMYQAMMKDRYFWSDYYKMELPAHGYEVEQLVIDAKPLQILWAQEHGIVYSETNWYEDIIIAQINSYKPELLFIQDWSNELGKEFISLIKDRCPSVKIFVGYCGEGHPGPGYFSEHSFVISCAKDNVDLFKRAGLTAYHIYHAFYPGIYDQLSKDFAKTDELGFIGRVYPASIFHRNRALFLAQLSRKIPFTIHGEIKQTPPPQYSVFDKLLYNIVHQLERGVSHTGKFLTPGIYNNYLKYKEDRDLAAGVAHLITLCKDQYLGIKMFDLLRKYKMLLNYHISPTIAANLRMFEVTGMGTCLVTDWKENLEDLFEPDQEVVVFKSVEEAVDKITFLRENPAEIEKIAQAGMRRTLRDHTYNHRALDMHNIIADFIKQ